MFLCRAISSHRRMPWVQQVEGPITFNSFSSFLSYLGELLSQYVTGKSSTVSVKGGYKQVATHIRG